MPSLLGLSPEEISAIANTRVADQNSTAYMLSALGGYKTATDIVDVDFGGKSYKVRRQDLPEAVKAGAVLQELPSKIAANTALEGQRNAAAQYYQGQATSLDLVPMELNGKTYQIARKNIPEAIQAGAKMMETTNKLDALKALGGVPPEQLSTPENFGNLLSGAPGVAASVVNTKFAKEPRPTEFDKTIAIKANTSLVQATSDKKGKPLPSEKINLGAITAIDDTVKPYGYAVKEIKVGVPKGLFGDQKTRKIYIVGKAGVPPTREELTSALTSLYGYDEDDAMEAITIEE